MWQPPLSTQVPGRVAGGQPRCTMPHEEHRPQVPKQMRLLALLSKQETSESVTDQADELSRLG